jgi:hypothetical protein
VLKDLGLGVRDKTGKLITVDDPRLDPGWEECGKLGIPAAIHVTDPEAFFHPIDNTNAGYEELTEHLDWGFYGRQSPRKRQFSKPETGFSPSIPTPPSFLAYGQLAGEPRLCIGDARQVSQRDGGIRYAGS